MNRFALLFAAVLVAVPALAGDAPVTRNYLEPDQPPFPSYSAQVNDYLKDAFAPDVRFRVIVEPSFQPEFAVGVRDVSGSSRIFVMETSVQLWGFMMYQADLHRDLSGYDAEEKAQWRERIRHASKFVPKDAKDITVKRCEIAVAPELAAKLTENWSIMLRDVRVPGRDDQGLDGEFYHFSIAIDDQLRRGVVWSPPGDTSTGLMVQTIWAMRKWCETKDPNQKVLIDLYTNRLWSNLH